MYIYIYKLSQKIRSQFHIARKNLSSFSLRRIKKGHFPDVIIHRVLAIIWCLYSTKKLVCKDQTNIQRNTFGQLSYFVLYLDKNFHLISVSNHIHQELLLCIIYICIVQSLFHEVLTSLFLVNKYTSKLIMRDDKIARLVYFVMS